MGSLFSSSKNQNTTSATTPGTNQEASKHHVRLVVLHNRNQEPDMGDFRDALDTQLPSLTVVEDKPWRVPDDGLFPEPTRKEIADWISEWANQGRIVLICLLTDYDVQSLKRSLNNNKIIEFCFRIPRVNCRNRIDVDFDTATTRSIKEKMDDLAAAIRGA